MNRYCPICFRRVSAYQSGKVYRHGFKKNRWIFKDNPDIEEIEYKKVDGEPCLGSGKIGITRNQINRKK